jgi:hypothetical protein
MKRMTPSELRYRVQQTGSSFFDRNTLRFFGDTMSNFGCSSKAYAVTDRHGSKRQVFAIWRKHKPNSPLRNDPDWSKPYYFDAQTFARVYL